MRITQPKGSGSCAACVAAMATNTTVQDVYDFLNDGRVDGDPIHDPEVAMYLLKHGWVMGRAWGIAEVDGPDVSVDSPKDITLEVKGLEGIRAYLVVKSRNYEGVGHAVFFDGHKVLDPDPSMPSETDICEYKLMQIWPLTFVGWTELTGRLQCPKSETPRFVLRFRSKGVTSEAERKEDQDS